MVVNEILRFCLSDDILFFLLVGVQAKEKDRCPETKTPAVTSKPSSPEHGEDDTGKHSAKPDVKKEGEGERTEAGACGNGNAPGVCVCVCVCARARVRVWVSELVPMAMRQAAATLEGRTEAI